MDVLHVVIDATTLILGRVRDHDVIRLVEQGIRVELLTFADGAAYHLLAPTSCLRLRAKLVRDDGEDLAILVLALVLDDELPAIISTVLARRLLDLLQPSGVEAGWHRLVISRRVGRHFLFLSGLVLCIPS